MASSFENYEDTRRVLFGDGRTQYHDAVDGNICDGRTQYHDAVHGNICDAMHLFEDYNLRSSSGNYNFKTNNSDDEITKAKYVMETNLETDGERQNTLFLQTQTAQNPSIMAKGHSGENNSEHWDHRDELQLPKKNNDGNVQLFDVLSKEQQQKCPELFSDMLRRKKSFVKCRHLAAYNLSAMSHMLAETGLFFEGDEESATCFSCGVSLCLSSLVKQFNLWKDHIQYSPNCVFLQKKKEASIQNGEKQKEDDALIAAVRTLIATTTAEALIYNGYSPWYITNAIRAYYVKKGKLLKKSKLIKEVLKWDDGTFDFSSSTKRENIWDIIAKFLTEIDDMTTCTKQVISEKSLSNNAPTNNTVDGSDIAVKSKAVGLLGGAPELSNHNNKELTNANIEQQLSTADFSFSDRTNHKNEELGHEKERQKLNISAGYFSFLDEDCPQSVEETHRDGKNAYTMEQLELDNSHMRDQITCKICLTESVTVTFLPCGHLVCCGYCASAVHQCPLCRTEIDGRIRVYLTASEEATAQGDIPILEYMRDPLISGIDCLPDVR